AIELPRGTGKRVNAIINLDDKRSITQINNTDSICLVRAVLVALSYRKEELQEVFKDKLTVTEIKDINYRRQIKTKINEDIILETEIAYLRKDRELQTLQ